MITEWEICKASLACAGCNKQFAEEQAIHSGLYDESPSFCRRDFCETCWPAGAQEHLFSHWQTRLPKRDAPVRTFVDDDIVLDLFRRLAGNPDPAKRNFRFVIGLLLVRRKVLRYRGVQNTEAGPAILLAERATGEETLVPDPGLTSEQIQQVTEELSQLLNARI